MTSKTSAEKKQAVRSFVKRMVIVTLIAVAVGFVSGAVLHKMLTDYQALIISSILVIYAMLPISKYFWNRFIVRDN